MDVKAGTSILNRLFENTCLDWWMFPRVHDLIYSAVAAAEAWPPAPADITAKSRLGQSERR